MSDREEARRLGVAIRKKCLDCSGGMINEVKRCNIKSCPLWAYRIETRDNERRTKLRGQMDLFSACEA